MVKNSTIEAADFIPRLKADLERTIFSVIGVFLLLAALKLWLKVPLSKEVFLLFLPIFLITVFLRFFLRKLKEKEPEAIIKLHFVSNLWQITVLTVIACYAGGITWIVPFFYTLAIVNAFWIYPKSLALLILGWSSVLLISLTVLQYFGILPGIYIFRPEEQNFQNFPYVLLTTVGALTVLFFIGFFSNTFYTLLNNKIEEFKEIKERLEEAKKSLEIEVQERTKEAEGGKKNLEREIRERTKELEEERKIVQEKVRELEKSHEITVVKELRMIKLKNKIAKLKNFKPKS